MSVATQINDHEVAALERLLEQYKQSDNLKGILNSFNKQIQEIEDAMFGLFGKLDIMTISGDQLDRIGDIVGQTRLGTNDETYRLLIYARIGINNSTGTTEEIINIFTLITQSTIVDLKDLQPAAIQISGNGVVDSGFETFVKQSIQQALVAGVSLDNMVIFDDTESFMFADEDGGTTPPGGFGFDDEDAPGDGGKLGTDI